LTDGNTACHAGNMPKRIRKHPEDEVQAGITAVQASVSEKPKRDSPPKLTKSLVSQLMAQIGRKGGRVGGKRRAEHMTPEQRRESASRAARARWGKN
jgi:hypothetical protein